MHFIIMLTLYLTVSTTTQVTSDVFTPRDRLQEDSIDWEYQNEEKYSPSTYNSNNNILDSQDGGVKTGNGFNLVRFKY